MTKKQTGKYLKALDLMKMAEKGSACQLVNFVRFLRVTGKGSFTNDPDLICAIKAYLGIDFAAATKAVVNEA